jgi:NTP pyrophosphatase (non-canonical NTP hydrolase)
MSNPVDPHNASTVPADASDMTLAAFQQLIRDRYFATDSARGVPGTFMWFIEEVGELSTSLQENGVGKSPTPQQRANLEEEFADVLAWLATLANISGVDLTRAVTKYTRPGRVEGVKD